MDDIYVKYSNELFTPLSGLYSDFDARYLYSVVRENKPKKIIDFAPREGKTTSCIIQALLKNLENNPTKIKYYVFEKDVVFLQNIKTYLLKFVSDNDIENYFEFYFNKNIIYSEILDEISEVDFLFIDANHDYILAKWYIDILFKKVNKKGVIHIHDIYFNKNNNGWDDTTFLNFHKNHSPHPDYSDLNVMKSLYPEIFNLYYENEEIVNKFESDIIKDYYINNSEELELYCTIDISKRYELYDEFNCSMYFKIL